MVGFNADHFPSNVYNLVIDNLRLHEVLQNPKDAQRYGVDHLINDPTKMFSH